MYIVMESIGLKSEYSIFKRHWKFFDGSKKVLWKGIMKALEKSLLKTGFWTMYAGKLCLGIFVQEEVAMCLTLTWTI